MTEEITLMTKSCARDLTNQINSMSGDLANMLKRAHDERAWEVLEYTDWKSYVSAEIKFSEGHAFRLLDFANISQQIADLSVDKPLPPPRSIRVTRELKKVEPTKRPEVYAKAVESAGGEQPTAKQVEAAAVEIMHKEPISPEEPAQEKQKEVGRYIPALAMQMANQAIRALKTITSDDSERMNALNAVLIYVNEEIQK